MLSYIIRQSRRLIKARIAQLVEQWIEDPRVPSSNLGLGIRFYSYRSKLINFVLFGSNFNFTFPRGPFLCFAIINSVKE